MRRKIIGRGKKALVVFLVIIACFHSKAELITIGLEAVVTEVDDLSNWLEGSIQVDDIITGYYSYESTVLDTNPDDNIGEYVYNTQPYGIFLESGVFEFGTDLSNVNFKISILNNDQGRDRYLIVSYNNLPLSGGTNINGISWQLDDYSENALSSTDLPVSEPVLSNWENDYFDITGGIKTQTTYEFLIRSHVTQVELVPEPTTLLLFSLGSLLLRKRS